MNLLRAALDHKQVQNRLRQMFGQVCPQEKITLRLAVCRMLRYKAGRRALFEYEILLKRPGHASQKKTLIGKARLRGEDVRTFYLQSALWNKGFSRRSPDGISVPQPVGVIPELRMWVYYKAPGTMATELLPGPEGVNLAGRIAQAAHKIHTCGIISSRTHTISEELSILRERLSLAVKMRPDLRPRINRIGSACVRLGEAIPVPQQTAILRDFYSDQVIVNRDRLYLIDLDLYCCGDPALDIGNFIGHLKEQALRSLEDADALLEREQALIKEFLRLSGRRLLKPVEIYTTLTLARHIYISMQFPQRCPYTEEIIQLCEKRIKDQLK